MFRLVPMRRSIVLLALPLALAAACGRSRMERDQNQYDVVQEGSASGVTSTIGGAGATPPLTGTNADTTTAFTLDPRLATTPPLQPEGTLAETLPPPVTPPYGSAPATQVPQPAPRRAPEPSPTPPPAATPSAPATPAPTRPAPAEPPRPAVPPATDTVAPPPPATDTIPPTDTTTTREKPNPEKPTPPRTDTAEPPPPATRTDTAPG